MEQQLLNLLAGIAERFGVGWAGILATAASLVVITNFLKATSPFSKYVFNSRVPYVVIGLALGSGLLSYWGHWVQVAISAALTSVIAIGGWATAKILVHKSGTPATNASGGGNPAANIAPPTP